MTRRDRSDSTPAFTLSAADLARLAEVEANCRKYRSNPAASIDLELEHMHRQHCYKHRPILSMSNSLNTLGDLAFDADWIAHREQNMTEAYAAWYWALAAAELAASDLREAA